MNEAGPGGRYDRIVDLYVIWNRGKDLWFINMAQPNYYAGVIHARFVQIGLGLLVGLLVLGNLVMQRMIDMRI